MSGQPDSDLPRFRFGISIGRIGYGVGDEPKAPRPTLPLRLGPQIIGETRDPYGQWSAATQTIRLGLTMIFAGKWPS